ncbi:MAG: hypothetical protein ACR2QF_14420 [Geminicoccaceae bacterium]
MTDQPSLTARFIVRLWLEPGQNGHGHWRGQIEAVSDQGGLGGQTFFEDGLGLLAFLRSCLRAKGSADFPDSIDDR